MKILLLGANGQVGWALQRSLAPLGQLKACDRKDANLEDFESLRATLRDDGPDVIVNAAAYTAVDKAESEPDKAGRINAEAVGLLANEAKHLNAWLIHYSTDYVFDGTKTNAYSETDTPNPQSVYGKTKLAGEEAIRNSGCRHLIFRTSWVYSSRGSNFARTLMQLAKERDELKVVADQFGAPTSAELIADVTALCLYHLAQDKAFSERASGTYHLCPAGETTWHGFAQYLIAGAQNLDIPLRLTPETIHPIPTAEYRLPAKRPANSRLVTRKLRDTFGLSFPKWQDGIDRLLDEWRTYNAVREE